VINISDLSPRVIAELKVLHDAQTVLKQAVGPHIREYRLASKSYEHRAKTQSKVRQITMMSVSEAKQVESCKNVTITGMITSYSTSYKVVSESKWTCGNLAVICKEVKHIHHLS
jgi:hypothetical protein